MSNDTKLNFIKRVINGELDSSLYNIDINEGGDVIVKIDKNFTNKAIDILLPYFDEISVNKLTMSNSIANFNNIIIRANKLNMHHNVIENNLDSKIQSSIEDSFKHLEKSLVNKISSLCSNPTNYSTSHSNSTNYSTSANDALTSLANYVTKGCCGR